MASKKELEEIVKKLEQKVIRLQEPAEAANLKVASTLREWHLGGVGTATLSATQEKAMHPAQQLGNAKQQLETAKKDLEEANKKGK